MVEYEGFHGYPSFCQIAHRKHHGRVQFALIHMPHGGTSPTNMIESLATHFRQQFYPKVDPSLIDWFDFVAAVIDRSRKIRQHNETAPHRL